MTPTGYLFFSFSNYGPYYLLIHMLLHTCKSLIQGFCCDCCKVTVHFLATVWCGTGPQGNKAMLLVAVDATVVGSLVLTGSGLAL